MEMEGESIHCDGPMQHAFLGDPFDPAMRGRHPKVSPRCGGSWLMVMTATAQSGARLEPTVLFTAAC